MTSTPRHPAAPQQPGRSTRATNPTAAFNQNITSVINVPPPVSLRNLTPSITMPAVDGHRNKQNGKDKIDTTAKSVPINFGDDANGIEANFVLLPSPVPELSSWALLLVGLACVGCKAGQRGRAAGAT